MPGSKDRSYDLETARASVEAAARVAWDHFQRGVEVRRKADATPVTEADLASETAILDVLRARDPDAGILAEESGAHRPDHERRWIVDPIDGTRGFTRGGEFWGPLVALEEAGEIVAGAMALPARNRFYWGARGLGAFRDGQRLQVSSVRRLSEATISLGEASRLLAGSTASTIISLAGEAASMRCYGDLAGIMMVLDGQADVWLESGVQPWDIAPSRILLEEAGGRWTTLTGGTDLTEGSALGTNAHLHDEVLARLTSA